MFARKSVRLFLGSVLSVSLLAAGCSSKGNEAVQPTPAAPAAVKTVPQLKIALPGDNGPLNLYTSNSNYDNVLELVFDKLMSPSPYVENPQPWLAESVKQLDDLNWVVKLRSGIKWHDGTPFTAEDVKFTFEYFRDGPANRFTHHVNEVPNIKTIQLDDSTTVRMTCAYACPTLDKITFADLPILPKHIWKKVENPRKFTDLPIGTGPYKLVEYQPDQFYKFEANKDYFKGRPLVDSLVMPIIKDPTAIFNSLRTGEIDISGRSLPPELEESFKKQANTKVVKTSPLNLVDLRLNYDNAPFNVELFRQAVSLSIDRKAIVDTVLLSQARPAFTGYSHPDSPWSNPKVSTPYDAAKAKSIMDQLQYTDRNGDGVRETPDGKALDFSLKVASTEPALIRAVELMKQQFANVGIKTTVESLDSGTIGTLGTTRKFDMYLSSIVPHGVADPDQFVMSHRSNYLWTKGRPYPAMDALTEKWMAEPNIEKRKALLFEMQELYNRQPTSIGVYYPNESYAYRSDKYDQWMETPGYGIINKYSFLPEEARKGMAKKQ